MNRRHGRISAKLLSLLLMVICVFALAGCESTTIDKDAYKTAEKQNEVYQEASGLEDWAVDMIAYLNAASDEQIRSDAENAISIADYTKKNYPVDPDGMEIHTVEMYNSWIKTRSDLGQIKSIDSMNITPGSDISTLCVITVETTYELRKCTFEFTINTDHQIEGAAINPAFTLGEKMSKAGMNTLIGLGFVFIVLIFISWVISLLKHVNRFGQKKAPETAAPAPVIAEPEEEEEEENLADDTELVAVIAAAIAAAEGTAQPNDLVVRSIKKIRRRS
ncbi:MAG: OadG family protein [Lachnospiraceae bacterium]|nr:OadG family protein [Lachnospiraceae bacterium]MCH4030272.1 OadG family protein [Lachnospiraceae bacterium]MCH4069484.1 OadG family protein [Lachnospiraceae bacterium]MCH4107580.1 OadG family protein [Lachnospiraceae bacterium]MCI1301569.1 OadG family protein [Lachnospiraceae bacterium]